jgi:hypothetical protein
MTAPTPGRHPISGIPVASWRKITCPRWLLGWSLGCMPQELDITLGIVILNAFHVRNPTLLCFTVAFDLCQRHPGFRPGAVEPAAGRDRLRHRVWWLAASVEAAHRPLSGGRPVGQNTICPLPSHLKRLSRPGEESINGI